MDTNGVIGEVHTPKHADGVGWMMLLGTYARVCI